MNATVRQGLIMSPCLVTSHFGEEDFKTRAAFIWNEMRVSQTNPPLTVVVTKKALNHNKFSVRHSKSKLKVWPEMRMPSEIN
jgi:hypothetical protein